MSRMSELCGGGGGDGAWGVRKGVEVEDVCV